MMVVMAMSDNDDDNDNDDRLNALLTAPLQD